MAEAKTMLVLELLTDVGGTDRPFVEHGADPVVVDGEDDHALFTTGGLGLHR